MKVFAVYANVAFSYKPAWLDVFRATYDKPYPCHMTLKQPCYVDTQQLEAIKDALAGFFRELQVPSHAIAVAFDQIITDETEGLIMLGSTTSSRLEALQKDLVALLHQYQNYYEPGSQVWEQSFHPHITIARDLAPQLFIQAISEVPANDLPKGIVHAVTLVAVDKVDPHEASKPENLSHYRF